MERRQFIRGFCGSVVAWPVAAYAQQLSSPRRIGVLGADATVWRPWIAAFAARLRELGWLEDETIAIDYRWAEGSSQRVSEVAAEFLRRQLWKRGHYPKAGDNDNSYRLCRGLRSGP
jgi:putative tryptophan/tyrosine transport system substrate-binding protein